MKWDWEKHFKPLPFFPFYEKNKTLLAPLLSYARPLSCRIGNARLKGFARNSLFMYTTGAIELKTDHYLGIMIWIITSYGTLVRDLEIFEHVPFLCVIGDEAQHLKNRRTQNAQAMSTLNSDGRVLLTGTPIENSVSDLLSLLEFLLPGARPNLPSSSRGDERIWHEQRVLKESAPYFYDEAKRSRTRIT